MAVIDTERRIREGRSAAVLWVAAVGAALLAAASALFIAVRWSDIPPEGKLGVIVGVTALCLASGETLRSRLPVTGGVLFHLGAFLLPIDIGAVNLKLGLSWGALLLVEGVACAVAFGALGRLSGSKILIYASTLAVIVATIGFGEVSGFPAPLLLAMIALGVAIVRPLSMPAIAWAMMAGSLPVLVLPFARGAIDLTSFELLRAAEPLAAFATGAISAAVLARAATLKRDLVLAFFAFGTFATSAATAWISADVAQGTDVALAGAFLVAQAICLLTLRDAFWSRPTRWLANASEVLAVMGVQVSVLVALFPIPTIGGSVLRPSAAAFAFLAIGWVTSTVRRRLSADDPTFFRLTAIAAAFCGVAAVRMATTSEVAIAIAMIAGACALLATRSTLTDVAAALGIAYVPMVVGGRPLVGFVAALVGASALTVSAGLAARDRRGSTCSGLTLMALVVLASGCVLGSHVIDGHLAALIFGSYALAIARVLDRFAPGDAFMARIASLGTLVAFVGAAPGEQLILVVPLLIALIVEAVRTADVRVGYIVALPLQLMVVSLCGYAGLDVARTGIVLCVAAIVWGGLGEVVGSNWRLPFAVAASTSAVAGLLYASQDAGSLGVAMIVVGVSVFALGLMRSSTPLAHSGGALSTIGFWIVLADGGAPDFDAYMAPVAAQLWLSGFIQRRRNSISSVTAYVPAVAILAGAAIFERIAGGSGWHAVVAGAVGLVAVISGGYRRLGGPLVVGTIVLAIVTCFESLAVVATIPTWAWLAVAGSALVATAILLERNGTTPLEAGRRLVDVFETSFN